MNESSVNRFCFLRMIYKYRSTKAIGLRCETAQTACSSIFPSESTPRTMRVHRLCFRIEVFLNSPMLYSISCTIAHKNADFLCMSWNSGGFAKVRNVLEVLRHSGIYAESRESRKLQNAIAPFRMNKVCIQFRFQFSQILPRSSVCKDVTQRLSNIKDTSK